MSEKTLEQIYTAGEVIYEFDEPDIDALYFVLAGKVKVEAKFNIIQDHKFPISRTEWRVDTQVSDICYFVEQLEKGQCFGLEELVQIGVHNYKREYTKAE